MARTGLFLLALCCVSFALIDPPVQQVDQYDRGIAPQGVLHQNFLNYSEKTPTLDDPTTFFYVKILTLTPSVGMSITSKLHPSLIWLISEQHNATVNGGYDNGDCERETITRQYGEMKVKDVSAYYTLDGLRQQTGNATLYNTANATVVLATGPVSVNLPNGSINITAPTFNNPSDVPFKPGIWCTLVNWINTPVSDLLGGMVNLSCYEESLAYASPYGTGVYNLTVRNLTIVDPHLSVTLTGEFTIAYTEQGTKEYLEGKECRSDSWDTNGTLTLDSSDSASYEVQNDYMTLLPYLPGVFSLNGNSSEDVMYHFSLLSNSNLYKYYSVMDNQTAGAYYVDEFNVTQDGYGTEFITATEINRSGLLPEDPQSQDNYTGGHRILDVEWGNALRSPTEMNGLAYNYSRVYDFTEVFYNVSDGGHHADFEFYTWFGNYSATSDVNVSSLTAMTLEAYPAGNSIVAVCSLTSRGKPVAGQAVELRAGNQTVYAVTNGLGLCNATFDSGAGATTVSADFRGTPTLLPSSANYAVFSLTMPTANLANFSIGNFGLLLVLAALFAFSFMGMARNFSPFGGGAAVAGASRKFYPFAPKGVPKGKPALRVKQGKELATSVAMAVATGGAGGAAGGALAGKAADEAVKKKLADEAARAKQDKIRKEMTEKPGRKDMKKGKASAPGGPPDGEDRGSGKIWRVTKDQITINKAMYVGTYQLKEELLDGKEVHRSRAAILEEAIQKPHISEIHKRVETAAEVVGNRSHYDMFMKSGEQIDLKIVPDKDLNRFLIEHNDLEPRATLAITIDNTVYIRESGMYDEKYLQEVIKHENYHPYSKLKYAKHEPAVEGFNEIMKYEDIIRDKTVPSDLKKEVSIIEGAYRDYAAEQHLVREIIGNDEYVIGHLVKGEGYLSQKFDNVAGENAYEKIFAIKQVEIDGEKVWIGIVSDDDRIKQLRGIIDGSERTLAEKVQIAKNVQKIIDEGKYDI